MRSWALPEDDPGRVSKWPNGAKPRRWRGLQRSSPYITIMKVTASAPKTLSMSPVLKAQQPVAQCLLRKRKRHAEGTLEMPRSGGRGTPYRDESDD